mmetsp:Transcript_9801/g.23268  ORF Transcript_9801/g.23268 Transcript_9801/m.23268 type:complete len:212 (+) Transcript_9801:179-814(+)
MLRPCGGNRSQRPGSGGLQLGLAGLPHGVSQGVHLVHDAGAQVFQFKEVPHLLLQPLLHCITHAVLQPVVGLRVAAHRVEHQRHETRHVQHLEVQSIVNDGLQRFLHRRVQICHETSNVQAASGRLLQLLGLLLHLVALETLLNHQADLIQHGIPMSQRRMGASHHRLDLLPELLSAAGRLLQRWRVHRHVIHENPGLLICLPQEPHLGGA